MKLKSQKVIMLSNPTILNKIRFYLIKIYLMDTLSNVPPGIYAADNIALKRA